MDWSSFGALPIGLVFFAGTAFGVWRRRAGYVAARAEYPDLATELGLTYRPSRYATGVGTLRGSVDGFNVVVDPDERRSIWLSWPESPGLALHHRPDTRPPPPGLSSIRVKNQQVASFFSVSFATPDGAKALGGGECLEPFVRLLAEIRALKDASITSAGITLSFDFGSPPFIPVRVVRKLVPAMISLARTFSLR